MKPKPGDVQLVLRPMPHGKGEPDSIQRLRRLLKSLKRAWGFQCVDIRPLPPIDPAIDPTKSEPPF